MNIKIIFKALGIAATMLISDYVVAQEKEEDNIQAVAEAACDCTYKISVELSKNKIIEEINGCITGSIISSQIKDDIDGALEKAVEVLNTATIVNDTTLIAGDNTVIIADKNFEEIQAYMYKNCKAVKHLMATDNEKLNSSMSKNKKALAFYEEGQGYSSNEQYDMAIVSFNKAVKADPKFVFAWDNLGISYRRMGNYKEAIKCYQKSLDIEPKGTMPLQNMAVAYEYLKDYNKAGETYEKFIGLYPDDPEGYYGAGRTYYVSEKYGKGVDYMMKAYLLYIDQKSPYVNDALTNIRQYYAELKEKDKLEVFIEAAKKNNIDIKE